MGMTLKLPEGTTSRATGRRVPRVGMGGRLGEPITGQPGVGSGVGSGVRCGVGWGVRWGVIIVRITVLSIWGWARAGDSGLVGAERGRTGPNYFVRISFPSAVWRSR